MVCDKTLCVTKMCVTKLCDKNVCVCVLKMVHDNDVGFVTMMCVKDGV